MSVNAVALRRILRSIGQHVPPTSIEAAAAGHALGGAQSDLRGRRVQRGEQRRFQHTGRLGLGGLGNEHPQLSNRGEVIQAARPVPATQQSDDGSDRTRRVSDRDLHGSGGSGRETPPAQASEARGQRAELAPSQGESEVRHASITDPRADYSKGQGYAEERRGDAQVASRRRSIMQPTGKAEDRLRPYYFRSVATSQQAKARRAVKGRKLLKERHTYPEHLAWQDAFNILVRESQPVKNEFGKRMEKISLPEGIVARWSRDPGESILEILQRTGCTVRTICSNTDSAVFPSLTLWGTPRQNAAAAQLMRESDLLIALGQADMNASKKFADHKVRIEVTDAVTRDANIAQKPQFEPEDTDDQDDNMPLQGIVRNVASRAADTGNHPPTRALWSLSKPRRNPLQSSWDSDSVSWSASADPTAFPTLSLGTPSAFTLQIRALTSPHALELSPSKDRPQRHFDQHIKDRLVELLTSRNSATLITTESLIVAFSYLARHMQFPAIRALLEYFESSNIEIRVEALIPLFRGASIDANINAFRNYLKFMQKRGMSPLSDIWLAFRELTFKIRPAKTGLVYKSMLDLGVYEATKVKAQSFNTIAPELLLAYMKAHPSASFADFVRDTVGMYRQITQMNIVAANAMIDTALRQGKTEMAYEIVDTLVKQKRAPDTITLNTFLTAARRDESVQMAVVVLRKFHDLRVHSRPMASNRASDIAIEGPPEDGSLGPTHPVNGRLEPAASDAGTTESTLQASPSPLTRHVDLSVYLDHLSFSLLLKTAWERRSWNAFRVFWRYACMSGYRDSALSGKMIWSLRGGAKHEWQAMPIRRRVDGKPVKGDIPQTVSRAMMWDLWAARFAVGLGDGLRVKGAGYEAGNVGAAIDPAGEVPSASSPPDEGSFAHWRDVLDADQAEAQSLRPLLSISRLAERAFHKDAEWKKHLLGLPKGLENPQWRKQGKQAMLGVMLSEAVEVPVAPGDGSSIRA